MDGALTHVYQAIKALHIANQEALPVSWKIGVIKLDNAFQAELMWKLLGRGQLNTRKNNKLNNYKIMNKKINKTRFIEKK